MKQNLQRIEATLHQLAAPSRPAHPQQPLQPGPPARALPPTPIARPLSFEVRLKPAAPPPQAPASPSVAPAPSIKPPILTDPGQSLPSSGLECAPKTPNLPRLKASNFTSHRNAANPALALNLLKEIEVTVTGWQEELQQVLRRIQDLYLEGPIVDGWLESYAQEEGTVPAFRHADVDCLMNYVETHWGTSAEAAAAPATPTDAPQSQPELNPSGYRLCGLNEDGQLWFRHCPAEQVPAVSLAIARYQKLRQLLGRKQHLETQLSQLAETLVRVHGQLQR